MCPSKRWKGQGVVPCGPQQSPGPPPELTSQLRGAGWAPALTPQSAVCGAAAESHLSRQPGTGCPRRRLLLPKGAWRLRTATRGTSNHLRTDLPTQRPRDAAMWRGAGAARGPRPQRRERKPQRHPARCAFTLSAPKPAPGAPIPFFDVSRQARRQVTWGWGLEPRNAQIEVTKLSQRVPAGPWPRAPLTQPLPGTHPVENSGAARGAAEPRAQRL